MIVLIFPLGVIPLLLESGLIPWQKWQNLKQYSLMDELSNQLKTMNRQFCFYMKHKTAMKSNLIGMLDQTYPSINTYFDSPTRSDGSQKWGDFASTY